MTWPLSRGATLLFVLVLVLQIVSACVFLANLSEVRQAGLWVLHTHEVITELAATQSALTDAESRVRGYVLTGDESFVELYRQSAAEVTERLDRARQLVEDNPAQSAGLASLEPKIAERLAALAQAERLRREGGLDAVLAHASGRGQQLSAEIRNWIGELTANERGLLAGREREMTGSFRTAIVAVVVASLAGMALIVALLALIARELEARRAAEAAVQRERQSLQVTLASIGDAVIVVDVNERITFLNQAAEQVTGWTLTEALRKPLSVVFNIINETTRAVEEGPAVRRGAKAPWSAWPIIRC